MHPVHFTAEAASDGVVERDFIVGEIPGILWSPATGGACAPLVLLAHGGGQHKRAPGILGRAHRFVIDCGFHAAAIDAPAHGGRAGTPEVDQQIRRLRHAQATGEPITPIIIDLHTELAAHAVPEWRAVLTALQRLPEIGGEGPVGFWGIMQGSGIGVRLVAAEPRITAAVFGGLGAETLSEAASRITVPVEFLLQWDDEHIDRQSGLALFDAFASKEKTLHANAGGHVDVPRFEVDSAIRFFGRHLGSS
jgi:dienelactone hydrolase